MGSFRIAASDPVSTSDTPPASSRERWAVGLALVATFAIRAILPGQPIVENYVGRQIPTAMVARNLERNFQFLRPELDTGPFPNLFLVEPPVYAALVVAARPIVGFDLEATGRLASAAATALGAWGLYGLARRREGPAVAMLALGSFGMFPVMMRYGRAFQPDALMVGFVLSGLRGWDEYEATGDRRWAALGGFVLATGLALKITSAWALLPFVLIVGRWPVAWRLLASAAMLMPGFSWYLYAWGEVARPGSGSLASSDNAAIWFRSIHPGHWLRFATWSNVGWGLVVRSFTPVGFGLAVLGSFGKPRPDRLWVGWGVGCGLSILGLAAKWHHAYYWMAVAPLAAVLAARGLRQLRLVGRAGRPAAWALGSFGLALCVVQSASTWRTPPEWAGATEAAREVRDVVPVESLLIAPEALLYLSDRKGFRLEFDPEAVRRAAGELGKAVDDPARPLALVDVYLNLREVDLLTPFSGAREVIYGYPPPRFVADVGPTSGDARRAAWRAAIRARPDARIRVDRPGLLIAEFP